MIDSHDDHCFKRKKMKLTWYILVFICGALLPLQMGFNNKLARSLESPAYASLIAFIVGALAMTLYIPFSKESVSWVGIKSASFLTLLCGGVFGAIYITATMLALPRIGLALTFGLVVAGQVIIAVLLDHFNILVAQQHSMTLGRVVGIGCIILGVILVQKF
jgi:transporter family-2 protein